MIEPNRLARSKFYYNRGRQQKRGQQFDLTLDEWFYWWLDQGVNKNEQTGYATRSTLCLGRIDESLPYRMDNIVVKTQGYDDSGRLSIKTSTRPASWIHKDPDIHKKYLPFLRMRAQCNFRAEPWDLSFEDFCWLWPNELWDQRGRHTDDLCMSREDPEGCWDRSNTIIITRNDQLRRSKEHMMKQRRG